MPSIVVVESDSLVRRIFRFLLEDVKYAVHETARAAEALRHCRQNTVDLAIVDTFLPKEEGLQLIRQLRADYPHLKIIALTGGILNADLRKQVEKAGIDGLLDKPFPPSELLRLVHELIGPGSA